MTDYSPSLLIQPEQVIDHLGDAANRFHLHTLSECTSTNSLLMKTAEGGAASGTVIVVDTQSAGRGSRGRRWHSSPEASLAFSLLWRFDRSMAQLTGLSLAVGVAVVRALTRCGARDICLKWPNDILSSQGKLGGILIELVADIPTQAKVQTKAQTTAQSSSPGTAAVIGIGLNLRPSDEFILDTPFALPASALSDVLAEVLADRQADEPTRPYLLAQLLIALAEVLDVFTAHGFSALRDEWQDYHAWQGQSVCLLRDGKIFTEGLCLGADDEGALRLKTTSGVERYLSGDVSLRSLHPLPTLRPLGASDA